MFVVGFLGSWVEVMLMDRLVCVFVWVICCDTVGYSYAG